MTANCNFCSRSFVLGIQGLTLGAIIGLGLGSIEPAECAEEAEWQNKTELEGESGAATSRLLAAVVEAGTRLL